MTCNGVSWIAWSVRLGGSRCTTDNLGFKSLLHAFTDIEQQKSELRARCAHPLVSSDRESLAGYGLAVANTLDQAVAHYCVLVLTCNT